MDLFEKFKIEVLSKPGKSPEYLVGLTNNNLSVIDFRYTQSKQLIWICKCTCGRNFNVRSKKAFLKRIGCISCTASIKSEKINDIPYYSFKKRKFKEYKYGALKRHLKFELTEEEFFNIITQNCYYCGETPEVKTTKYKYIGINKQPLVFNGIDRVDSSIGYIRSNVVPCCSDCNYGKHKKNIKEFLNWIKRVYDFNFNKFND